MIELIWCLLGMALCVQDLKTQMISTWLLMALGAWAFLLPNFEWAYVLSALLLVGGGWILSRWTVRGHKALGLGDVYLLGALGLTLSPIQIPFFLILAGLMGVVWSLALRQRVFPFAPSLVITSWWVYFFPQLQF